jgi:colanic acid biosynthesis glycosyl transferase WcaI
VRILLVNRFFGGDQVPTGRMLADVATELAKRGHEIDVLVSDGTYAGASGKSAPSGSSIRIAPVWTGPIHRRLAEWAAFWAQACLRVPFRPWDRCLILTDPPFMATAAALARARGRKGVYWWTMDLYPESLVARGMIGAGGLAEKGLRFLNETALSALDGVICLGERQQDHLRTYNHWPAHKGFGLVVPPWDLRPIPRVARSENRFLARYGWQGKRIALYAGNLGEAHSFEGLVSAARLLAGREDSDLRVVFVVRGAGRAELERQAGGLSNVVILDYQPPELTADMLWAADVHLITMREGWEGVVVPSKLYGVLQTDAPVLFIGPADADTAQELHRLAAGEQLSPHAPAELIAESLDRLAGKARREPSADSDGPRRIADFLSTPT